MTLESTQIKDLMLTAGIIESDVINDVFKNVEISDEGLSSKGISTDYLYAEDSNIKADVYIEPVDNHGEKIATIVVNDVSTEISANSFEIGDSINVGEGNVICAKYNIAAGLDISVYTDNSTAFGEGTIAGTRCYRVVSGDADAKTWTLKTTEGLSADLIYSIRLWSNFDAVGKILSVIDNTTVSVDSTITDHPEWFAGGLRNSECLSDTYLSDMSFPSSGMRAHWGIERVNADGSYTYTSDPRVEPEYAMEDMPDRGDINTMWIVGHPDLGDLSSWSRSSIAEGYHTIATKQFSHAEGEESWAVGKYAHAEGMGCVAGYNGHAEGNETSAFGYSSHAEGRLTLTRGTNTHAAGVKSAAINDRTYVWNGDNGTTYSDNGTGTFNINPLNGIRGAYIDDRSVYRHFHDVLDEHRIDTKIEEIQDSLGVDVVQKISLYSVGKPSYGIAYLTGLPLHYTTTDDRVYGSASFNVKPGEQISIDWSFGAYAGMAVYDRNDNVISTWHNDISTYVNVNGFVKTYTSVSSEYSAEFLDAQTAADPVHWYKLDAPYGNPISVHPISLTMPDKAWMFRTSVAGMFKLNEAGGYDIVKAPAISVIGKQYLKPADISKATAALNDIKTTLSAEPGSCTSISSTGDHILNHYWSYNSYLSNENNSYDIYIYDVKKLAGSSVKVTTECGAYSCIALSDDSTLTSTNPTTGSVLPNFISAIGHFTNYVWVKDDKKAYGKNGLRISSSLSNLFTGKSDALIDEMISANGVGTSAYYDYLNYSYCINTSSDVITGLQIDIPANATQLIVSRRKTMSPFDVCTIDSFDYGCKVRDNYDSISILSSKLPELSNSLLDAIDAESARASLAESEIASRIDDSVPATSCFMLLAADEHELCTYYRYSNGTKLNNINSYESYIYSLDKVRRPRRINIKTAINAEAAVLMYDERKGSKLEDLLLSAWINWNEIYAYSTGEKKRITIGGTDMSKKYPEFTGRPVSYIRSTLRNSDYKDLILDSENYSHVNTVYAPSDTSKPADFIIDVPDNATKLIVSNNSSNTKFGVYLLVDSHGCWLDDLLDTIKQTLSAAPAKDLNETPYLVNVYLSNFFSYSGPGLQSDRSYTTYEYDVEHLAGKTVVLSTNIGAYACVATIDSAAPTKYTRITKMIAEDNYACYYNKDNRLTTVQYSKLSTAAELSDDYKDLTIKQIQDKLSASTQDDTVYKLLNKAEYIDAVEIADNVRLIGKSFTIPVGSKRLFVSYQYSAIRPYKIEIDDVTDYGATVKHMSGELDVRKLSSFIGNPLVGKTYLAIGDSFTEGDFSGYVDASGKSGKESDAYDKELSMYKTYPWCIAKDNSMSVVNVAKCGGTMHCNKMDPRNYQRVHFSEQYLTCLSVLSSADYITFMYGLNEQMGETYLSAMYVDPAKDPVKAGKRLADFLEHPSESYLSDYAEAKLSDLHNSMYEDVKISAVQYGTKNDSSISTIWGAWNTVLSNILSVNPDVKMGMILCDGGLGREQYDTQLSIARYWGIPVLDLKNGNGTALIGGYYDAMNPYAKQQRNNAFRVSDTNGHPSIVGHKFRSTMIANFLKSL